MKVQGQSKLNNVLLLNKYICYKLTKKSGNLKNNNIQPGWRWVSGSRRREVKARESDSSGDVLGHKLVMKS